MHKAYNYVQIKSIKMQEIYYKIEQKEFMKLSDLASNVYNIAVVADYFCSNQPEVEECDNLTPVIKELRHNADRLNAFFINNQNFD